MQEPQQRLILQYNLKGTRAESKISREVVGGEYMFITSLLVYQDTVLRNL